ncbi:NAD(P)/FAD-dependent oxidoreductase [Phyllobacterium salinisoli]|uniref:Thioredoxin reductase n=1 Tax=Phyllobacterium salinisoli TaxID=1899321 RepID=A0A368K777_9HYPH|nr:NAD(P)/FAD-dependent oxidoreductase [Phyllobacterium salinisoli]RCS24495.1 NAD(P)/FAD-dependent oxidoreductase [Phyllobacterium salinisoli]
MQFDVIIIGGSYAGMAAALQLARARCRIMMIDAGQRRNRFAEHSHGFLGRDGHAPDQIAEEAKQQLLAYPTVTWTNGKALGAAQAGGGFRIETEAGQTYESTHLILALGVEDILPDVPGLKERWGKSVFHCPYCHGYELDEGSIGVLAVGPISMHQALMLPDWGKTSFFINDTFTPDDEQLAQLSARGVTVVSEPVAEITGHADIRLASGRVISLAGLFTAPATRPTSPLAEQLGCALEEGPLGPFITTNAMKETTIPRIFACGDAARAAGSVSLAVGDGAMAGAATHRSLMFG